MNPESKLGVPELVNKSTQGAANELAVTVWFFCWNSKVIVSPTWVVMLGGLKAMTPVPPTITRWSVLDGTVVAEGDGAAADEAETEGEALPVAAALKAAKLLPGLTAKTMPDWQCVD